MRHILLLKAGRHLRSIAEDRQCEAFDETDASVACMIYSDQLFFVLISRRQPEARWIKIQGF